MAFWVEVPAGRLAIGGGEVTEFMDVEAMCARCETSNARFNENAIFMLGESNGAGNIFVAIGAADYANGFFDFKAVHPITRVVVTIADGYYAGAEKECCAGS
jgi:hypothetical protein